MSESTEARKNLWGELPTISNVRAPVAILREQGEVLEKATQGLLSCRVSQRSEGNAFRIEMALLARSLDNYTFSILEAYHGVTLYPVTIFPSEGNRIECKDQESFENALSSVLQSETVRRAISGLLTQMKSDRLLAPLG